MSEAAKPAAVGTAPPPRVRSDAEVWAVSSVFVLIYGETLLNGLVGGVGALLVCLGPVIAFACWSVGIQAGLSRLFRSECARAGRAMRHQRLHALLFAIYCLFLLFSIVQGTVRGSFDPFRGVIEVLKWGAIIATALWIAVRAVALDDGSYPLRVAFTVLLLTAVGNVLLLAIGIRNGVLQGELIGPPETGVMLQLIGFDMTRIVLPLGTGTRGIHSAAGVAMGFALFYTGAAGRERLSGAIAFTASIACLFVTDSRGGMLAAFAGIAASLAPAMLRRRARWLAIAAPVLPVVLVGILASLQGGALFEMVARPGEGSVGLLSGRPLIWASIVNFLSDWQWTHLIGFGQLGQVASGANANYGFLFESSYASTETAGAHNTLLQSVLDQGYIGAVLMIALMWRIYARCAEAAERGEETRAWGVAGVAAMTCVLVLGMTDSTLSVTNGNTLVLFLLLNVYCLVSPRSSRERTRRVAGHEAAGQG